MCHQMILGAGRTTVVAPLLAIILADGKSLVTQVVPHAPLDFSSHVMRKKFIAVVRKPVFTFSFNRGTSITHDLYTKLCKARDSKPIIRATPTSVQSAMLKFAEMMRHLERPKTGGKDPQSGGFFIKIPDEDLASETLFAFRVLLMVMMICVILLVHLVNFTWIRCPHEPAAFDMKHHTAELPVYMDQSHSCKQRKYAAMFHLGSYILENFAVSQ